MKNAVIKKFLTSLLAAALVLGAAGCSNTANESAPDTTAAPDTADADTPDAASGDKEIVLAFSFGQSVHPFFVAMQKGAQDAAAAAGVELVVQSADNKLETQVTQVENFIQRGVDAVLINPIDSEGVANVVNSALEKNIGVFPVDINVIGATPTSFVASDNTLIGKMEAEYIIEKLGGEGDIAMISNPTVTSTAQREQGFLAAIEGTNINMVANQGKGMERTTSLEAAETILQANPQIKAFVGVNESSAMGILSACTAQGRDDIIIIIGVDATDDNMTSIKNETAFEAAVSQDPYLMGQMAVENAIKWINGEEILEFTTVPIEMITIDNVDEFIKREAAYAAS